MTRSETDTKDGVRELALSRNALKVLEKRCLIKDENGNVVETPEGLFRRVSRTVAGGDSLYGAADETVKQTEEKFYDLMMSLRFLPNSPTLMNAGKRLGQLSACFVIPVGDSMEEIFDGVKYSAIIHKSGGGTGFSFSRLRPSGDVVASTGGISSGPISFMRAYDAATDTVKQGGARRGANMGLLRVDHPDILDFIRCKDDASNLNNFNISVGLTEDFMKAVESDAEYELLNPRSKKVVRTLRSKEVFHAIVKQAWKNGEPGIVFLDRMNAANPTPHLGEIESTNPCGEQPLLSFESCNLGSINLGQMVTEGGQVEWELLKKTVRISVHFLDNVIDVNCYPLEQIDKMTKGNRKIGLGVMGWADMLVQMKLPYNSEEAFSLADEVMGFIAEEGKEASNQLARERGHFPNFGGSIYDGEEWIRNATVTTIAPTGTLSIIAGCSSGIEPIFAVSFVRTVLEGAKLIEVNPYFEKIAKERGFWSKDLMERIAETGSIQRFPEIPEDVKGLFVTAHDISPLDHIRMQATFQKHVDNAVSKTVNFSSEATMEDVEEVYIQAYRHGCKGVTVYRDGSRENQVLSNGRKDVTNQSGIDYSNFYIDPMPLPTDRVKHCVKVEIPQEGDYEVEVTVIDNRPREMWMHPPVEQKIAELLQVIMRLMSVALRCHVNPKLLLKQVKEARIEYGNVSSPLAFIERALIRVMGRLGIDAPTIKGKGETCHECGGTIEHEGGCKVCHGCGMTTCS